MASIFPDYLFSDLSGIDQSLTDDDPDVEKELSAINLDELDGKFDPEADPGVEEPKNSPEDFLSPGLIKKFAHTGSVPEEENRKGLSLFLTKLALRAGREKKFHAMKVLAERSLQLDETYPRAYLLLAYWHWSQDKNNKKTKELLALCIRITRQNPVFALDKKIATSILLSLHFD